MKDDLNPKMRARLEKWRKKILPITNEDKIKQLVLSKCRFVRGDYGDDIRDFEQKRKNAWAKEIENDPIYREER